MPFLERPTIRRPRGLRRSGAASTDAADEPRRVVVDSIEAGGLRWIQIHRPGAAERAWLEEHFDFHPLALEDVVSRNQRPKVDEYEGYLFIVLHFPAFDKATRRLAAAELDIFVGSDFIVTIPSQSLKPVDRLFDRLGVEDDTREELFSKGSGHLLYKILDECVDASFPMLRVMGNTLDRLEEDIFEGRSSEIVRDISNAKQEIITFRRLVRPQRTAFRDLERAKQRFLGVELDVYFDDLTDASERIWDLLENYREVVEALESSNESVLSHRVNDILRVLTSFSVVILPLTLIASVFGMNVVFPGEGTSEAFVAIVVAMLVTLAAMLGYFRHRGWL